MKSSRSSSNLQDFSQPRNPSNHSESRVKIFTVGDSSDSLDFTIKTSSSRPKYGHGRAIKQIYKEYVDNSTIHGLQYLREKRPLHEKLFWIIVFFISIVCCSNLTYNIYMKWCETPVIVSFSEKSTPVWNIPFPAVTICSETKSVKNEKINFTRFYNHLKRFNGRTYEPPHNMSIAELNNMRSLLQICGNHLVNGVKFPDFINFELYNSLQEIAPPFAKAFPFCKWVTHLGGCESIFYKTFTEEGICYTFNGLNSSEIYREDTVQYAHFINDSTRGQRRHATEWSLQQGYNDFTGIQTFPERVLGAGPRGGLFVNLQNFEQNEDFICRGAVNGFKAVLHSPDEVPQVTRNFIRVPNEKEVVVLLKPNMITTLKAISDYEPNRRQCFFARERYLRYFKIYTQVNCERECLTNYTLSKCGCVKFSMPRTADTPVCDETKIHCFDLAEDDLLINEFAEGLSDAKLQVRRRTKCNCLPACTSLVYSTEISQGDYDIKHLLASHGDTDYFKENRGAKMSRLALYFKENQFITSKRSELYGMTDFVANCGGLFGLFMGFSVLSLVEIVYHITIRLMTNIHRMRRS